MSFKVYSTQPWGHVDLHMWEQMAEQERTMSSITMEQLRQWFRQASGIHTHICIYIERERWEWNFCSMGMRISTWEANNSHFSYCNKTLLPCWSDRIYPLQNLTFLYFLPFTIHIKFSFPVLSFQILDRPVPAYHFLVSNWLNDYSSSLSTPLTSMKLKYQENTFLTRLINDSILSLCRSLPLPHFIHPSEQNETTEEINFPAAQNEAESMFAKHFWLQRVH